MRAKSRREPGAGRGTHPGRHTKGGTIMKKRLPGLAVMLALAAPLASEAQRDNPHRIPTSLPGVTAYAPPPAGFDPVKATDEELADWGFPPRPDQTLFPEEYANWVRVRTALK